MNNKVMKYAGLAIAAYGLYLFAIKKDGSLGDQSLLNLYFNSGDMGVSGVFDVAGGKTIMDLGMIAGGVYLYLKK